MNQQNSNQKTNDGTGFLPYSVGIPIFVVTLLLICMLGSLVAFCIVKVKEANSGLPQTDSDIIQVLVEDEKMAELGYLPMPDHKNLYYHYQSKIVYTIIFLRSESNGSGYAIMSPFYSESGKLCRLEDDKIMPVN